jgi:protein TonB
MYQPDSSRRDRAIAITLVVAIHVTLALALISLSGPVRQALPQEVVEMFDVIEPPLPEPPVVEEIRRPKMEREEGAASPPNIESKATPIADPKPRIELPVPVPMPVSPTPDQGSQPTQGAAPVPGPGTGAGGVGTGTGGGGSGAGSGGGGGGGVATPSRILRKLGRRDFPPGVIESTPRGGRIFTRLRIEANGRVSQCDVMRSFGDSAADQWTCALIRQKATFQPATDRAGQPVASWFGYVQEF